MVTFVNELHVKGDAADFERISEDLTSYMIQQPGYVSHQMLRSLRRPDVFLEIAVWASAEDHSRAVGSDGFRDRVRHLVEVIEKPSPDLFEVVRERRPSQV